MKSNQFTRFSYIKAES